MANGMTGWLGDRVASLVPAVLPSVTAHASECSYLGEYLLPSGEACQLVYCSKKGYFWSSCYP
jgi:hypothetical protein